MKFLMVYHGGMTAATPAEPEKANMAWTDWFKAMSKSLVDIGAPTMPGKVVSSSGMMESKDGISGYTVIQAKSIDEAAKNAQGAPGLERGLKVEVYPINEEIMPAKK